MEAAEPLASIQTAVTEPPCSAQPLLTKGLVVAAVPAASTAVPVVVACGRVVERTLTARHFMGLKVDFCGVGTALTEPAPLAGPAVHGGEVVAGEAVKLHRAELVA